MRIDRAWAQEQLRGDLLARRAGGDEAGHLELLRGELPGGAVLVSVDGLAASEVVPRDLPEDRAVRAVVAQGGPRPAGPGLVFREAMRGSVAVSPDPAGPQRRRRVVLRLAVQVPDLQTFLDDPVHAALLGGTVEVEGLTRGPAAVDTGSLHLLTSIHGGPQRTMDYIVPFVDDDGVSWLLQGSKLVCRRRAIGPWRAITRLQVALTAPGDRYDATVPTGTLTISVVDAGRLLLSLRPTGTASIGAAVTTLLRFGGFFAARVLRAFLSVAPPPGPTTAAG